MKELMTTMDSVILNIKETLINSGVPEHIADTVRFDGTRLMCCNERWFWFTTENVDAYSFELKLAALQYHLDEEGLKEKLERSFIEYVLDDHEDDMIVYHNRNSPNGPITVNGTVWRP